MQQFKGIELQSPHVSMCPRLEAGKISPTKSVATVLKEVSMIGIFPAGTFDTRPLLTVLWQTSQEWQNRVTSSVMPGHQKLALIRS